MKDIQVLKKELIEKAMHCKNAEELMALAESEGIYARGTEPGGAGENRRMSRFIVFDCISNFV